MKEIKVNTRIEFNNLLREIYIPYMNSIGCNDHIKFYTKQKEFWKENTGFCTDTINVELIYV
jgi:hypothetical protein